MRTNKQTENREQTDREFNYRGPSNPVDCWVERGPIIHSITKNTNNNEKL